MKSYQLNFVKDMNEKHSFEFVKLIDGVYRFKKHKKYGKKLIEYMYYTEGTCSICMQPHFKRRNNKTKPVHIACQIKERFK